MNKHLFIPLTLLVMTPMLWADVSNYKVDDKRLNALPLIPKSKASGLDPFSQKSVTKDDAEVDGFENLKLDTNGNKNASMMSGLNVGANKRADHDKGYKRPRIGIVLSGGGARGGAHLGVIKAFEKHHIPIDAIVGTSMGSFIGGLYASGMSSSEIERMLTTMDWSKVITVDYDRKEIPYRRKKLQRAFPGHAKVGINSDNEVVFGTGLFKRQTMLQFLEQKTINVSTAKSFDELRIPFRSVASRLEDGATVVLRDGSLAESIYASIAIPGGFDPITVNGEVLVDGGVADNLPLDVMRNEMNVDYIVVVDISTPYDEHAKFDNYIAVMSQLINILMRKNVEQTISTMTVDSNETLLTPDLHGYTPLDADKYPEIITIGYKTAEGAYNKELSHLSLYESDYYEYLANRPQVTKYEAPIIDKIEIQNPTYINNDAIRHKIHAKIGEPIDMETLNEDLMDIYNMMIFDDVTYEIKTVSGENVLVIMTTPSWDVNGQIKFAVGFEDNFDGHSDYLVKLEYIQFGLNSYAGEWRTRVSFGQENLLLTELYQPIDPYGYFYVRPAVYYRNKKVYVTPQILDIRNIEVPLDKTFTLQARDYGGVLGFGVNINNDLRVELIGDLRHVNPSTNILSYTSDSNGSKVYKYNTRASNANVYDLGLNLQFDNMDHAFFPTTGHHVNMRYHYSDQYSGKNPLTYNQYFFEYTSAFSFGKSTIEPHIRVGSTFSIDTHGAEGGFSNSQDFNSFYTLGGLFNLSGLPSNALTGNNMAFGSLLYRYRLTEDNFFGSLGMPIFAGASIERGGILYGDAELTQNDIITSGSGYIAADTLIGPFYLAIGAAHNPKEQQNYYSIHLSLGQSF